MIYINIFALSEKKSGDIIRLWNNNFIEQYHITENMLKDKVFNDADLFSEGSFLLYDEQELKGFIISKINACGVPGYEDTAWISSMLVDKELQGKGIGTDLYKRAEEALKRAGIKEIILGGEVYNFFSGIPEPSVHSIEFFSKQGFTINEDEHYDLMADVSAIDFSKYDTCVNSDATYFSEALCSTDMPLLDDFFTKCFPDRWRFEVMGYLERGGAPENVVALKQKNEIIGFCKININRNADIEMLYGPCSGSLGPIGVSEAVRGKGLGKKILLDALKILKLRGAHNVIIDWTVLKDFYGQFGFAPWKTYKGAYKSLL